MSANEQLFHATYESLMPGEGLPILGGTFPGKNDRAEVRVGLKLIIPFVFVVTGDERCKPRENDLVRGEADDVTALMERGDKRLGHDYGDGPDISYGKRAATILGETVDLVLIDPMTAHTRYMIVKPVTE